jgi:dienelactone hydrolase
MIVTPEVGLIDGPLHVLVRNLPPRAEVTIRASLRDDSATTWNSCATYRADDQGAVDLARHAPISGFYAGVDEEGLITSLRTAPDRPGRTFDNSSLTPLLINFVVEAGGRELARAAAHRLYVAAGVEVTTLREGGLSGLFFQPPGDQTRPGVLVLGGSSGKLVFASQAAALLAAHGFPSLALAYFGAEGLPSDLVEIPIDYFSAAMTWLTSQAGVNAEALGVIGRSRGAELALLLGSRFQQIRSVVAYCPSSVVWNGLRNNRLTDLPAWRGSDGAIPFASLTGRELADLRSRTFQAAPIVLTPLFEAALERPMPKESIIAVEQINGPILLVSGEDDRMWPSARMGAQIVERLVTGRHRFAVVHRRYAQAGHLMRTPGVPTTTLRNTFEYGGVPSAQAAANRAAWIETIAFLRASLGVYSTAPEPAGIGAQR